MSRPDTAFPDPDPDPSLRFRIDETYVAALWKDWIYRQLRAQKMKLRVIGQFLQQDDTLGISHGKHSNRYTAVGHPEFYGFSLNGIHRSSKRNPIRFETGLTHRRAISPPWRFRLQKLVGPRAGPGEQG
jgi:hypothetical protein